MQDEIHDAFIEKLRNRIENSLVLGDGMDPKVNQGPLINQSQFTKVCSLVEDAKDKGAGVALGGTKDEARGGLFYLPTILTDVKSGMEVFKEEIFGPVISIIRFKHEEVRTIYLPTYYVTSIRTGCVIVLCRQLKKFCGV